MASAHRARFYEHLSVEARVDRVFRKERVGQDLSHRMNRVVFKSETVEWPTPQEVYRNLDREFEFDFDPCPIDGVQDGLSSLFTPWTGRRVFCNPPYGPKVGQWLERAKEADLAVYLIPARTDTRWFHELVL